MTTGGINFSKNPLYRKKLETINMQRGLVHGEKRRYETYDYHNGVNRKYHYQKIIKLGEAKTSMYVTWKFHKESPPLA